MAYKNIASFDCQTAYELLVLCFFDESSPVYYPDGWDQWNADLSNLRDVLPSNDRARLVMCGVSEGEHRYQPPWALYPDGADWPEEFELEVEPRSVPFSAMKRIYEKGPAKNVIMGVDNSGSMTRLNLEPGIDSFISWLIEYECSVSEMCSNEHGSYERWIYLTTLALKDFYGI